jgi:hypothetical protein
MTVSGLVLRDDCFRVLSNCILQDKRSPPPRGAPDPPPLVSPRLKGWTEALVSERAAAVGNAEIMQLVDPLLTFLNKQLERLHARLKGKDVFLKTLRRIWGSLETVRVSAWLKRC